VNGALLCGKFLLIKYKNYVKITTNSRNVKKTALLCAFGETVETTKNMAKITPCETLIITPPHLIP
jgi:hypothetical protein